MGTVTPDSSEKEQVHVERIQNAADNAVIQSAAGRPVEFAHLDEKKILRKVRRLDSAF